VVRSRAPKPATLSGTPDDIDREIRLGLSRNTDASNYLGWLADLCDPYVGPKCLELGSGHGDLTERLAVGRTVHASDVSGACLAVLEDRFAGRDNVSVERIDVAERIPDDRYDSIVMVNVLEHIEDDSGTVRRLGEALVPGGRLVLYVPAMPALYSKFDREIGHYRRYRKRDLVAILEGSGYRVVDARYINSVGAFGWYAYCRVLRRKASDQVTIGACDRIVVPALRKWEDRHPPPFGLSVFCVGERVPESSEVKG
jgi:SAM-dependent methyltransferase